MQPQIANKGALGWVGELGLSSCQEVEILLPGLEPRGRKKPQVWACFRLKAEATSNGEAWFGGHPSVIKEPLSHV